MDFVRQGRDFALEGRSPLPAPCPTLAEHQRCIPYVFPHRTTWLTSRIKGQEKLLGITIGSFLHFI
jgi:hypothetical protein